MINDKNAFYEALWRDYYDIHWTDKENSFIYAYLKKKKDIRAELIGRSRKQVMEYSRQKKRDKYTLLKSAYLAVERYMVMSVQDYADILKGIMGAKLPAKYEKLNTPEEMRKAQEMFGRRFLLGCTGDYFYNLGFRTNSNSEHGTSVRSSDRSVKEDGYNDELEMLYEFTRYSGSSGNSQSVAQEINDEYISQCQHLYETLLAEHQSNVFVPLYVDSATGAGVYIVGADRYYDESTSKADAENEPCSVCIIKFYDLEDAEELFNELLLDMMIVEKHRSVRQAFDSFSRMVAGQEFYSGFPYANDDRLPDDVDERFNLYFITIDTNEALMRKKAAEKRTSAMLDEEAEVLRRQEEQRNRRKPR